jgi:hypothetical protein
LSIQPIKALLLWNKTTAEANKNNIRGYSGKQPGDPERALKDPVISLKN